MNLLFQDIYVNEHQYELNVIKNLLILINSLSHNEFWNLKISLQLIPKKNKNFEKKTFILLSTIFEQLFLFRVLRRFISLFLLYPNRFLFNFSLFM